MFKNGLRMEELAKIFFLHLFSLSFLVQKWYFIHILFWLDKKWLNQRAKPKWDFESGFEFTFTWISDPWPVFIWKSLFKVPQNGNKCTCFRQKKVMKKKCAVHSNVSFQGQRHHQETIGAKGQLISEWIFDIIKSPKKPTKY